MFIMSEQKDELFKNPSYKILVFPVDVMDIAPIPFSEMAFSRTETVSEYIFSVKITKDQIEKFYDYHGIVKGIIVYASNEVIPGIEFLAKFVLKRTDDAYKKLNIPGYDKEINVHLNKLSHLWSVDVNNIGEEYEDLNTLVRKGAEFFINLSGDNTKIPVNIKDDELSNKFIFKSVLTTEIMKKYFSTFNVYNIDFIYLLSFDLPFPKLAKVGFKIDTINRDSANIDKDIIITYDKTANEWDLKIENKEERSESMNNKNTIINCLCMINPYDLLLNDNNFYLSFNSDNLDTSSGILLESYEAEDGLVFAIHLSKNDIETYKKSYKLNRIINLRLYAKDTDAEKPEKWNKSICTFVAHSNIINNIFSFDKDYKIIITYNKMKSKWSLNINDDNYTILESYAINYINRENSIDNKENSIEPDNKCKQIIIYNKETKEQHTGILLNNGNVICGCCGNLIKENLIGNGKDKEYQIITIYDEWVNMDDLIGE